MSHPTAEDFEAWRDNPVTQWVMRGLDDVSSRCRQTWLEASWGRGEVDPILLCELKTRADAYQAIQGSSYEAILSFNETDEEHAARLARASEGEEDE